MVLTTPMVLTYTCGIESVLLNHTRTRGLSVAHMRDFVLFLLFGQKCCNVKWGLTNMLILPMCDVGEGRVC